MRVGGGLLLRLCIVLDLFLAMVEFCCPPKEEGMAQT